MSERSDIELIELTLQDPEHFEPLMIRYELKLLRYVRRMSGLDQEAAEDVMQEVFLKIYRKLNGFDMSLKFSSWVYRIAHNETVNYLRKHRGKETVQIETDDNDKMSLIEILQSETDIVKEITNRELKEKVQKLLSLLPQNYREALVLRYLEDLSYAEISDILKKSIGTVSTLISRAKFKFKDLAIKNHLNE